MGPWNELLNYVAQTLLMEGCPVSNTYQCPTSRGEQKNQKLNQTVELNRTDIKLNWCITVLNRSILGGSIINQTVFEKTKTEHNTVTDSFHSKIQIKQKNLHLQNPIRTSSLLRSISDRDPVTTHLRSPQQLRRNPSPVSAKAPSLHPLLFAAFEGNIFFLNTPSRRFSLPSLR